MKKINHALLTIFLLIISFQNFAQNILNVQDYLKFIENKGQWSDDFLFKATIPNGNLFLRKNQLIYNFLDGEKYGQLIQHLHDHTKDSTKSDSIIRLHAFSVNFLNANPSPTIFGENAFTEKRNYFLGETQASNIQAFQKIIYEQLLNQIDLHIFQSGNSLKYEFHLAPHANPANIKMEYKGINALFIQNEQLHIQTSLNEIIEEKPYAYQIIHGKKKEISCEFVIENNILSYKLGHYHRNYPLIIDPKLIFSTYSGSTTDNWGNTACLDKAGNLYTGGTVFNDVSNGFPTSIGAFQRVFQGGHTDIGILKFDSSGTNLLYATYIGGNDSEIPTSLIANDQQELYILATTSSPNFPTSANAFQKDFKGSPFSTSPVGIYSYSFNNGTDISVLKLSADGSQVLASTFLGGNGDDGILFVNSLLNNNYGDVLRGDINIDKKGNVYVASVTRSNDFPIINGAQPIYGGGVSDGIVFKLNPDFSQLIWSTYLGGKNDDALYSIQRDTLNNVYVTGGSLSNNFPVTNDAIQSQRNGNVDAVITKIDSSGTQILHATYLGTSNYDQAYFIQLDHQNDVYILGQTKGNMPILPDSSIFHQKNAGLFVTKFSNDLTQIIYSTTLGDTISDDAIVPNISPTAFLINECENLFIAGWGGETNSKYNGGFTIDLPITPNAFQKTTDGSDFYLMAIQKDLKQLLYATYFGGPITKEHVDGGTSRFDEKGIVYQSVCAGCKNGWQSTNSNGNNDFPIYPPFDNDPNTYPMPNNSSNCNNGVIKFDLALLEANFKVKPICDNRLEFENLSVGGLDFQWIFGDGKDSITFDNNKFVHQYDSAGNYLIKLIARDITTCKAYDTSLKVMLVPSQIGQKIQDSLCIGNSIEIKPTQKEGATYSWFPTTYLLNNTNSANTITPLKSIAYLVEIIDTNGCEQVDTLLVKVKNFKPRIAPTIIGSCKEFPTILLTDSSSALLQHFWDFGNGVKSQEVNPKIQYKEYGDFKIKVMITDGQCIASDSILLPLKKLYVPNIVTPNNDGKNDNFIISGIENNGDWKLEIYNRWGKEVFKHEYYDNSWTGDYLNDGTYYYLLTAPDETTCKGWIQIVR